MASNSLTKFRENTFCCNLTHLKSLLLNSNYFTSLNVPSTHLALGSLSNLAQIDLSNNLIEFIGENDFKFSLKLNEINLNSNRIKSLHSNSFVHLNQLNILKMSHTFLDEFAMNLLNFESITELDLSYNTLNFSNTFKRESLRNLRSLRLERVKILNFSLENFLNSNLEILDLSKTFNGNEFFFKIHSYNLSLLKRLELRDTRINSLNNTLKNLISLSHLDLSCNSLTELNYETFKDLDKLSHLNLSFNEITFLDARLFESQYLAKNLKYLNLDHNRLIKFENVFENYFDLAVLSVSQNYLRELPEFSLDFSGIFLPKNQDFFFNENNITKLSYFSFSLWSLRLLNLNSNQIEFIVVDAFVNLKRLEILSLAFNQLTQINANNFVSLFALKHLNLSFNRINSIENGSFIALSQLISLDLSFNCLKLIEANLFAGLTSLNDLNLRTFTEFALNLNNQSFRGLSNLGDLSLNENILEIYACMLMRSMLEQREVKRRVSGGIEYNFYKSLNVLTFDESDVRKCELTFELLQFRIHLNLKFDFQNEMFYEECLKIFVKKSNSYQANYRKCFLNQTLDKEVDENDWVEDEGGNFVKILSNFYFYLIVALLLCVLSPIFAIVYTQLKLSNKIVYLKEKSNLSMINDAKMAKVNGNRKDDLNLNIIEQLNTDNHTSENSQEFL
jgi:hypothetical protein